ncbi:MAG: hypothetical protein HC866_17130 [Leptolyngbyaceae cyanobacterium RU_5_1]|nr:hypothetical protein [Leptolyngbyaceae cyanobacterium RU_5_1]
MASLHLPKVCGIRAQKQAGMAGTGFVFAPPSNVRTSPNGNILCSISTRTRVNLYGSSGSWYYTDACGSIGLIHSSQLEF